MSAHFYLMHRMGECSIASPNNSLIVFDYNLINQQVQVVFCRILVVIQIFSARRCQVLQPDWVLGTLQRLAWGKPEQKMACSNAGYLFSLSHTASRVFPLFLSAFGEPEVCYCRPQSRVVLQPDFPESPLMRFLLT